MNRTDFERASGGRKAKLSFSIILERGRIINMNTQPQVAKDLATKLQEDDITRQMLREHFFEISMNNSFQLSIVNSTASTINDVPDVSIQENNS